MICYSKYAEQKFDILNEHKVYIRKEQVEDCLINPDQVKKKGTYLAARKEDLKVVYKKQAGVLKVVTFYPVKVPR